MVVDADVLARALSLAKGTSLKHIIVIGQATSENNKTAQENGIELMTIDQVESKGKTERFETVTIGKRPCQSLCRKSFLTHMCIVPSDIASIFFSSSKEKVQLKQ